MRSFNLGYRNGTHRRIHLEEGDRGQVLVHSESIQTGKDLQTILDTAHEYRRDGQNPTAVFRHIGIVPQTLLFQWDQKYCREGYDKDMLFQDFVGKMLKDYEFKNLATGKQ